MAADAQTATIETTIPARLDRLPWSRFHWLVVIGLGTVWILDGLEVTIVGSVASRMTEKGSGIALTSAQIGTAAAVYVAGACVGALFFGQLTDRFGRKKLFILTLGVYIVATGATAFAFSAWYFYAARFLTGAGIGGEYAAINSAIDELIPARVRGRVDLIINGSYWVGSALGSAATILLLDQSLLAKDVGWRVAFGLGVVLGLGVLLVRRSVPESPRWLFIHGREDEAERIVDGIERDVREESGAELREPDDAMEVRQRETIPFREIAAVGFKLYPKRAVLALALFVGQAFIYNGVTFNLGTLFTTFYSVSSGFVPVFVIVFAVANFLGPLVLGRLFDTVGRKPMITATYLGSAVVAAIAAWLFTGHALSSPWFLEGLIMVSFFLASAGASAAYLTASEIFPMETRALAIAFFYAIGTAVGGITGPLLFGHLINSANRGDVAVAFYIGAAVMALGGIVELAWGVKAERQQLEDIAKPLTVEEAEQEDGGESRESGEEGAAQPEDTRVLELREESELVHAEAAEHRAAARELSIEPGADGRADTEETLAQIADLRAEALEHRVAVHEGLAAADRAANEDERQAVLQRVRAAEQRAQALEEQSKALAASTDGEERLHAELSEAARERARMREQQAAAREARAEAGALDGERASAAEARARVHEGWASVHDQRARLHVSRGEGDDESAEEAESRARQEEAGALAAEERLGGAGHAVAAAELRGEHRRAREQAEARDEAQRRAEQRARAEERIRERIDRRRTRERHGLRRYRPGPGQGSAFYSPGMLGTSVHSRGWGEERELDREIEMIAQALDEHGETGREELARLVGARYWGPGRFRRALREAVEEHRARRVSRSVYAPPG
jgi:MFS family permease